jgi:hypothetical protein
VSGQAAVQSAQLAASRRSTQTAADLVRAEAAVERMVSGAVAQEPLVGGRRFHLESGIWVDRGHKADARVTHIEPFSRAYFDLLASLPELKAYAAAFDAVTVAGGRVSIRIAPGGRSTLNASERDALVADFRGGQKKP